MLQFLLRLTPDDVFIILGMDWPVADLAWCGCHCCDAVLRCIWQESPALQPLVGEWLAQIPAGRLAEVTDLQAAVVFLASEASGYMTGHNLVMEGGQSLW